MISLVLKRDGMYGRTRGLVGGCDMFEGLNLWCGSVDGRNSAWNETMMSRFDRIQQIRNLAMKTYLVVRKLPDLGFALLHARPSRGLAQPRNNFPIRMDESLCA